MPTIGKGTERHTLWNVQGTECYTLCSILGNVQGMEHYRCQEITGNKNILECLLIGNVPSLYMPQLGQIQQKSNKIQKLEWTRTELNCFDKLTEVQNFTSGLTECTGDGVYICITSGENGFETLTYDRTSRAASSQLKTIKLSKLKLTCT